MNRYYSFPDNLRDIRKEHKMSQKELAVKSGLTQAAIHYYEAGEKYPRLDKLYDIAHALNIDAAELVK